MSDIEYNPYCPSEFCRSRVRLSSATGFALTGLTAVVVVQILMGLSTATVIHQEGTGAAGFIGGASLMTLIVAGLVGSAGTLAIRRNLIAALWGTLVTVTAWISLAIGVAVGACWWSQPVPFDRSDTGRFLLLMGLSTVTVNLVIFRLILVKRR